MSKAIMFLHSLEDARYAVSVLGLPLELIPETSLHAGETVCVTDYRELETAYQKLCAISASDEFTALRP